MRKLLYIFLDGVGVTTSTIENPVSTLFKNLTGVDFIKDNLPVLNKDLLLKYIDATLDVPGIPQSATGQTSLMTGVNAQQFLGYHLTAFPNQKLIELIETKNILLELKNRGLKVTCANIFSREYFIKRSARKKNMFPVSALSVMKSGIEFRFIEDHERGEAVFAHLTNNPVENMLNICNNHDFIFFEYFITDSYGHKKDYSKILKETEKINSFIEKLWNNGKNNFDIILTSDHGNSEDNTTANHTLNPVPFLYLSQNMKLKEHFNSSVKSITDFKKAVIDHYFTI